MRMHENRRQRLYEDFASPIMDLRVKVSRSDVRRNPMDPMAIDAELFALELKIWSRIKRTLNLTEGDGHG